MDAPLIHFDKYSQNIDMREFASMNLGLWCRRGVCITFLDDVEWVHCEHNVFVGKRLYDCFVVYSNCSYSKVNNCLHVAYSTIYNHYCFAHQYPHFSHIAHTLNYRVYR